MGRIHLKPFSPGDADLQNNRSCVLLNSETLPSTSISCLLIGAFRLKRVYPYILLHGELIGAIGLAVVNGLE